MNPRALVLPALLLVSTACSSGDVTVLSQTAEGQDPQVAPGGAGGSGQGSGGPIGTKGAAVIADGDSSCARLVGGSVKCWGWNEQGLLGLGDTQNRGDQPGEMGAALPAIDLGTGAKAVDITFGFYRTCALIAGGQVKCWGRHQTASGLSNDTLGDAAGEMGDALPFADLGPGIVGTALSLYDYVGAVLTAQGRVALWGEDIVQNSYSGMDSEIVEVPRSLDLGAPVLSLQGRGCALLSGGNVRCWLKTPATYLDDVFGMADVDVGTGLAIVSMVGGYSGGCAVVNGGRLKCWGDNMFGQLGTGDISDRYPPSKVGDSLPFVDLGSDFVVTKVAVGRGFSCAISSGGRVKCWGDNSDGRLGYGDKKTRGGDPKHMGDNLPSVDIGTNVRAVDLALGSAHVCVVLSDGRLKCWGRNNHGQLGLGDTIRRGDKPEQMGDALPFVDLGGLVDL